MSGGGLALLGTMTGLATSQPSQGHLNMNGIVLLVLIGVGVAWLWASVRKRMKLPVTGRHWGTVIVVVVVLLAIAYGATHTSH